MAAKVYDADEVSIIVAGIPISGFADGEFVRIEEEEQFSTVTGSDGEVTRSKTNQTLATLTFILMQTSASNAVLSALHVTDLQASGGAGIVPVLVRDRQGLSQFNSESGWVVKFPDESFDREATSREWMIHAVKNKTSRTVGGN